MDRNRFVKKTIKEVVENVNLKDSVNQLMNRISDELKVSTDLYFYNYPESGPAIKLALIKVSPEYRNQGLGNKAMQMIIDFADENGVKIFLTPSTDFGSSKKRLNDFYRRFGFIPNSGRNKDWHFKESLIRLPKGNSQKETLREIDLMRTNSHDVNNILDKFGISNSAELGSGSFGVAFNYGSNLVLKITTDLDEAIFANNIKGKKFERISDVQSVYKKNKGTLFIIILEKLKPITDNDVSEILQYMHIIHDSYNNRKEKYSGFRSFIEEKIKQGDWFHPFIQQLISDMPIEKIIWTFNEYDAILNELNTAKGIPDGFSDVHYGNMGFKNGKLAVYDIRVGDFKKWRINKIQAYRKLNENSLKEGEDIDWDLYDILDDTKREVMAEYINAIEKEKPDSESGKHLKSRQEWEVIPLSTLKRQWEEFIKWGFVKPSYIVTIEKIEKLLTKNICKINANTLLAGHTPDDPKHEWEGFLEGSNIPDDKLEEYVEYLDDNFGDFILDGKNMWRISDFALEPLNKAMIELRKTPTPEKKLAKIDHILSIVHMRSDIASWFVEGGSSGLASISGIDRGLNESKEDIKSLNIKNIEKIWKENAKEVFNLVKSFPKVWLDEVGIGTILKFLQKEDSMNFRLQAGMTSGNPKIFKEPDEKYESESEIDYLLRKNKIVFTWEEIESRLIQYFMQGIFRNIPQDKIITTKEQLLDFLNTYKEAFLYGYLKVMASRA